MALSKDIVTFAKDHGLAEVEEGDVLQLDMETQSKREQEAAANKTEGRELTAKILNEALGKIREGLDMLEEMDPNMERNITVKRYAEDALSCYTEMQVKFNKKKRQTTGHQTPEWLVSRAAFFFF